jgi:hypothetical protein
MDALDGQGKRMHQLCFIGRIINHRSVQARVNTVASHNFLRAELANDLDLKVTTSKT